MVSLAAVKKALKDGIATSLEQGISGTKRVVRSGAWVPVTLEGVSLGEVRGLIVWPERCSPFQANPSRYFELRDNSTARVTTVEARYLANMARMKHAALPT